MGGNPDKTVRNRSITVEEYGIQCGGVCGGQPSTGVPRKLEKRGKIKRPELAYLFLCLCSSVDRFYCNLF